MYDTLCWFDLSKIRDRNSRNHSEENPIISFDAHFVPTRYISVATGEDSEVKCISLAQFKSGISNRAKVTKIHVCSWMNITLCYLET